jgi:hypothetical protein
MSAGDLNYSRAAHFKCLSDPTVSTIRLDSSNYGGQTLHRISPRADDDS